MNFSTVDRTALAQRYIAAERPPVITRGSGHQGDAVLRMIESEPVGVLMDIERQLPEHEERLRRRMAREQADAATEAARNRPLEQWEIDEQNRLLREASEMAARAELPATRAQLAELISVQRDILATMKR